MTEKRPFTTSPDRDDNLSAIEQVRRAINAKGLRSVPFIEPGEVVAPKPIVVNDPVKEPAKESTTAQFLRELQEETMKTKSETQVAPRQRIELQASPRQRTKSVKLPDGFHDCGDPLCGFRELIRVEREKDRVRKLKTSPSGR